jgi:PhnB protein
MSPADNLPRGVTALSPHLICDGAADAIAFYEKAFGAIELTRINRPDGKILHACLSINGASIFLTDEIPHAGARAPTSLGGTAVFIHLFVADVDAAAAAAEQAGAKILMPVADQFWGDRYGQVEDPFGHRWSLATPKHRVAPEDLQKAADQAMAKARARG